MKYRVIKSSLDGIAGGDSLYSIEEACAEISYSKGWGSVAELRKAIKQWAKTAKPGAVFKAPASAIVASGPLDSPPEQDECPECGREQLNYQDLDPVEDGGIQQEVWCDQCGARWMDYFSHTERRELSRKKLP